MNNLERVLYGQYGASRAYVFEKLFFFMLALDTWMLMIRHAGRYGVAGFNVAQLRWLDAILPVPSAGFYIGVLLSCGLLSLVVVMMGVRRWTVGALCVLYTFSWSMSMLDSYQHHYLMTLMLVCLVFFPTLAASDVHPLRLRATPGRKLKRKKQLELERAGRAELHGWLYVGAVLLVGGAYLFVDAGDNGPVALFMLVAVIALATWFYSPAEQAGPAMTSGLGFPLLGLTAAIVYLYTAVAKMDAEWLAGHTIRQISSAETVLASLVALAGRWGVEAQEFWPLAATMVIPAELLVAVGYCLAVIQDRFSVPALRFVAVAVWAVAISLHAGFEMLELQIGWFSYYMMALACVYLLPLTVVDRLATVLTWPARFIAEQRAAWILRSPGEGDGKGRALAAALVVWGVLLAAGYMIDLPGAVGAGAVAGGVLMGATLAMLRQQRAAAAPEAVTHSRSR